MMTRSEPAPMRRGTKTKARAWGGGVTGWDASAPRSRGWRQDCARSYAGDSPRLVARQNVADKLLHTDSMAIATSQSAGTAGREPLPKQQCGRPHLPRNARGRPDPARLADRVVSRAGRVPAHLGVRTARHGLRSRIKIAAVLISIARCIVKPREAVMRTLGIILAVAVTVACGPALAQVVAPQATPQGTPNVVNPGGGLATPLTFTTTTCLMNCNSQVASCQTRCFIPTAPTPQP